MSVFSDNLVKARKDRGFTQENLSDQLHVSRDSLSQWERDLQSPRVEEIQTLCKLLECDSGYLLGEYEEKHAVTASICEQTGLSELAVDFLRKCSNDNQWTAVLNELFSDPALILKIVLAIYTDYDNFVLDNIPIQNSNEPKRLDEKQAVEFTNFILSNEISRFVDLCRDKRQRGKLGKAEPKSSRLMRRDHE